MMEGPRVRFAPSPTGYLHVGGARTALFNWLYARQQGGAFILRIEDTDRERSSGEMTRAILDGMRWLGLEWDEGPVHQADGLDRHREAALRLLEEGKAYRCFCTPEALKSRRDAAGETSPEAFRYDRLCLSCAPEDSTRRAEGGEPFTVRFRVPEGATAWEDIVHGETRFRNEEIEDFIILRTDGTPIYNLAVVSDDIEMRISHVLRGDDHLSNTARQILLYEALDAPVPRFGHLPMILGSDGKRLSKRHGATAVGEYAEKGILPGALVNFLSLLGWNPGDDREVMELPELIEAFSLERIGKKSAVFDTEKLLWMNGQHLMLAPSESLVPLVAPKLVEMGLLSPHEVESRRDWLREMIDLLKVRSRTVSEIVDQARTYLAPEVELDEAAVERHWRDPRETSARLEAVRAALASLDAWDPSLVEETLRATAGAMGIGFGKLVHPLRIALTGGSASPGIDAVIVLLGPERVDQRLRAAQLRLEPRDH